MLASGTGSGGDAELGCTPQAVWMPGSRWGWGEDSLSRVSRFDIGGESIPGAQEAARGAGGLGTEAQSRSQVTPMGPGVPVRDAQASLQQREWPPCPWVWWQSGSRV